MGTVYRARDLTDGATVAVKILNGRELREMARFDQEASILSGLAHPAIVPAIQRWCSTPNAIDDPRNDAQVNARVDTSVKSALIRRRSRKPRNASSSAIGTVTTDPTTRNATHRAPTADGIFRIAFTAKTGAEYDRLFALLAAQPFTDTALGGRKPVDG